MQQYSCVAGGQTADIRAAWIDLELAVHSPAEHFEWWQACLDGLRGLGQTRPYVVRNDGKCSALAPLVLRPGLPPRLESIGIRQIHEPMDFVYSSRDALAALCDELARQKLPIDLPRVPRDSPLIEELRRAFKGRGLVSINVCNPYPFMEIDSSWLTPESHFNAGRRSDFRRALHRAEKSGPVTFEVVTPQPSDLQQLLAEAYKAEMHGWKGASGTALAIDPVRADFFRSYFQSCCSKGILRLAFMRVGGEVVAMQIAVQADNRFWLLKIGYNEAFSKSSPGTLLMLHVVRYAAQSGLKSIEFLGALETWTQVWCKQVRECVRIRIYPLGFLSAFALGLDAAGWAMRRIRRIFQHGTD